MNEIRQIRTDCIEECETFKPLIGFRHKHGDNRLRIEIELDDQGKAVSTIINFPTDKANAIRFIKASHELMEQMKALFEEECKLYEAEGHARQSVIKKSRKSLIKR